MTAEQIKAILTRYGVVDMNDVEEIQSKVVSFVFDNTASVYSYPPDELHQLIEIDWTNELFYFREFVKGYAVDQWKPFDCLQQLSMKTDYLFKSVDTQKKYKEYRIDAVTGETVCDTDRKGPAIRYPGYVPTL